MHIPARHLLALLLLSSTLVSTTIHAQRQGAGRGGFSGHHGSRAQLHHGYRGYGGPYLARGWRPGLFWSGVGLGIGFGFADYGAAYGWPWGGYDVIVDPAWTAAYMQPQAVVAAVLATNVTTAVSAVSKALPEPVIYPRNGQSAAQIQADHQSCRQWAADQPGAPADADLQRRAVFACMDGRGYSLR